MVDGNLGGTRINSNQLNQKYPVIIPYSVDLDNSAGKHILYRTSKDQLILDLIDRDISLALGKSGNPSTFNAAEAIIVTYNNIPRLGFESTFFKFQVVIATDYTNTFAIINYGRLDKSAYLAGYSEPQPCKHNVKSFTESSDKRVLNRTSNVGRPGKHIHLLTVKTVKNCAPKGKRYIIFATCIFCF